MSDITVGSVAVSVVPDARKFREKLAAKLRGLTADVSLNADVAGLREKIKDSTKNLPKAKVGVTADTDALAAKVRSEAIALSRSVQVAIPLTADGERMRRAIADQVKLIESLAKIDIPVDIEDAAKLRTKMAVELDILKAMAQQAKPTVTVGADTAAAEAQIDAVARNRRASITADGVSSSLRGISGFAASIAILGPALVPITAAVLGLTAALAAPLAAAGGGLTLFGLIAGFAIKGTQEQSKAIADLSKKVAADKLTLSKATTPSGQKSAMLQLATDTTAYKAALAALSPTQKRFLDAQSRLKDSFHKLVESVGGAIFGPFIKGMDLLAQVMPALAPIIKGVAKGLSTLIGDIADATDGPAFKNFAKAFGSTARDAIEKFGRIFGNLFKGMFHLFQAFSPASTGLVKGFGKMAKSFANFDFKKSKGFQNFLGYVRDVGPKVADLFGHLFGALGKIGAVLAPLGGVILTLVDGIAKFIAKSDPKTLAIIATAIGGIGLAILIAESSIVGIVPLVLSLVIGLAYLVAKVKPLNELFQKLAGWVKKDLIPAFKDAGQKIIPALRDAFDSVKKSIKDNHGLFVVLGGALKLVGKFITNVLIPGVALIASTYFPLLGKAIGIAITTIRLLGVAFATMALVAVEALRFLVSAALNAFSGILHAADAALGWIPGIGDKIHDAKVGFDKFKDGSIKALDETAAKIRAVRDTLNNIKPKTVTLTIKVNADDLPELVGSKNKTNALIAGRANGGPVAANTPYWVGERGKPELFVPETNGRIIPEVPSGGQTGPMFHVDRVVAQDVNDFLRQMQDRSRHASFDGISR